MGRTKRGAVALPLDHILCGDCVEVMERLPDTFPLPEEALPPQTPPLHHASVHYADSL